MFVVINITLNGRGVIFGGYFDNAHFDTFVIIIL